MRLQHVVLTILFVLLAYTGFVHKFPDAFLSWPFHGCPTASAAFALHRICGWAFVVFFVAHAAALLIGRTGRAHCARPVVRLGRPQGRPRPVGSTISACRQAAPPHRRWNYAEKAEYWALVWGSVVMIVTGSMLIFTETVLRLLPKVWHDVAQVIHFYEAVLATLAILVWHFYWVIFDPDEYPMNPSWLIGTRASQHAHAPEPAQTAAQAPPPADEVTGDPSA